MHLITFFQLGITKCTKIFNYSFIQQTLSQGNVTVKGNVLDSTSWLKSRLPVSYLSKLQMSKNVLIHKYYYFIESNSKCIMLQKEYHLKYALFNYGNKTFKSGLSVSVILSLF